MVTDIPDVNTDAWASYVIDNLENGGTIRPEDLAALVGVQTQQTRTVIVALANSFNSDGQGGGGTGVTKLYVDNQDAATLAQAGALDDLVRVYAKAQADAALLAAKSYTDAAVGDSGVSQGYVDAQDDATLAAANAYASDAAGNAVEQANAYTDAQSGTGGVAQSYVDQQDAATLSQANSHADTGDAAALNAAKAYSDDSIDTFASGVATQTDGKITANNTAVVAPGDAATLAAAKAYTDSSGAGGGPTKTYVDTQDTATLNSAKGYSDAQLVTAKSYTDTGVASAKTYADQYALADTGWLTLTPVPGYQNLSTLQYRKIGKRVQLRGQIAADSGNLSAAVTGIATLPTGFRASAVGAWLGTGSTGNSRIIVNVNGTIDMGALTAASASIRVDPIEFLID